MLSQFTYKNASFSSQNWPKNTPVFQSDSSGKEKDSETGYHYFGARYYNSDLSLWLSVDPMSDKYPSLSPYNYCAWNPMKLVDPDGEEVEYSSFFDWVIVSIARIVSSDFNTNYKVLKKSEETYVFNGMSKNEIHGGGELTTDGKILYINYRLSSDETQGDNCFVNILHETEHAVQFDNGEIGFVYKDGEWVGSDSYDISDEYKAREAGYSWPFYLSSNPESTRSTWAKQNKEENIKLLRNHKNYAPLKDGPINNDIKERIQNEKQFARPYNPR